jgi:hypothetical protein
MFTFIYVHTYLFENVKVCHISFNKDGILVLPLKEYYNDDKEDSVDHKRNCYDFFFMQRYTSILVSQNLTWRRGQLVNSSAL